MSGLSSRIMLQRLSLFQRCRPFSASPCKFFAEQLPDPMKRASNAEKREVLGADSDPFNLETLKRLPSTRENPNMIPSAFSKRLVGCVCDETSTEITWMWLHKGDPKRCPCGHWFQLYYKSLV